MDRQNTRTHKAKRKIKFKNSNKKPNKQKTNSEHHWGKMFKENTFYIGGQYYLYIIIIAVLVNSIF